MDAKRPPLPLVLTGNDLLSGHSVFHDGEAWAPRIDLALVATDAEAADRLTALGLASIASAEVVDPYLTTVLLDDAGRPTPKHYRERIRVSGPTVAFAGPPFIPGAADVSL